jgi:hypothetical protein
METGLYLPGLLAGFGLAFMVLVPVAIGYAGFKVFRKLVEP